MSDPQPFPFWIIPLFPVFFVALWLFVTGLLATLGGWSELAHHYPDFGTTPEGNVLTVGGSSVGMRRGGVPLPVSYNRVVTLTLSRTGLHLRVMSFFRFRHPPILIPWEQVEALEPGMWHSLVVHPRGSGTRIRLYGRAARTVEEAWAQRAGAAHPAAV